MIATYIGVYQSYSFSSIIIYDLKSNYIILEYDGKNILYKRRYENYKSYYDLNFIKSVSSDLIDNEVSCYFNNNNNYELIFKKNFKKFGYTNYKEIISHEREQKIENIL